MSFGINISGHTNDADEEARVVEAFREAVAECGECVGSAVATTQHQGQVDLKAEAPATE